MVKRKSTKAGKGSKQGAGDFAAFMAKMNKDEALIDLGSRDEKYYKFGDYNLDRALDGGLPAGQIYAFQGAPAAGKSLAALTIAKQVIDTEEDGRVVYFDTEGKISNKALRMMGLYDNENFIHLKIENLEDTIERLVEYAESGFFKMLVVDSLDSLVTDEQEERDIHEGSKVGGYKAKVLSENLPSVVHAASNNQCAILFVQQQRLNPGAMFANPVVTSGGEAIKHAVTVRLGFNTNSKLDVVEDGKKAYQGASVRILKMANGAAPKDPIPIRFYIGDNHEWGIDKVNSTLDEAIRLGVFAPKSATSHIYLPSDDLCAEWDCTPEELTFNGKNNLLAAVTANEALLATVKSIVDDILENGGAPAADDEDDMISIEFDVEPEEDDEE